MILRSFPTEIIPEAVSPRDIVARLTTNLENNNKPAVSNSVFLQIGNG